jgi:PadR family transcriptional regulator AphA
MLKEPIMSVRGLCLAILSGGDATGYEIRKESTEGRFSYFDDASFGSIYPALARLEAEGMVTVREEPQAGKPARKVYSITDSRPCRVHSLIVRAPGRRHFQVPLPVGCPERRKAAAGCPPPGD